MWSRFKGQVLRGKGEKDLSDDDTIIMRALLKYYDPEVPQWLVPQGSQLPQGWGESELESPNNYFNAQQAVPRTLITSRMFDTGGVSSNNQDMSRKPGPGSGLAIKLKNQKW